MSTSFGKFSPELQAHASRSSTKRRSALQVAKTVGRTSATQLLLDNEDHPFASDPEQIKQLLAGLHERTTRDCILRHRSLVKAKRQRHLEESDSARQAYHSLLPKG
eukprot:TRINITY_DN44944_c0_g1_i1.p2 TRINITY_DN44944_c0_g1~~TRINITY_DN44944_c0_g1_i1.p2  ORF type:complete len:106 (-),score=7.15 TRINITY_DN44944_c0_g1_i1:325-642(-)